MTAEPDRIAIGTVEALYRYPVKSMGGEALDFVDLSWAGIDGDRQFAFYRTGDHSRFPWFTGRMIPDTVLYRSRYADSANPRGSTVRVVTPAGEELDIRDEALRAILAGLAGEDIRLIQVGRGNFDAMPVSVITTATREKIEQRAGRPVDIRRFRPNIVIRPDSMAAAEADWCGGTLVFGAASLSASHPNERCSFITVDPDSAAKDVKLLRIVAQDFNNCVGIYCTTARAGRIALGDRVFLSRPAA